MDLKAGPQGQGAFPLNEMVTCDYVEAKSSGNSPKFDCAISPGDVVKVKYGKANGEVQAEVLSTRLLWALGFGADRMYPVRVTCRGCSTDPSNKRAPVSGEQFFDPAVIERKLTGHEIQTVNTPGWTWQELDLVDETQGGAPRAQRDALKLLAVFIQHSDSKQQQQRLLCVPLGDADRRVHTVHDAERRRADLRERQPLQPRQRQQRELRGMVQDIGLDRRGRVRGAA